MPNTYGKKVIFDPLRSLAFGSIGAAYAIVGDALEENARLVIVQNLTDTQMLFSFNGTDDHFTLPAGGQIVFDFTANKATDSGFFLGVKTKLYVKQVSAPSSGSVYFSYARGED